MPASKSRLRRMALALMQGDSESVLPGVAL
jgi:hypothetical protein